MTTLDIIRKTKAAWSALRDADAETKNRFLTAMADSLVDHTAEILTCNETDLEAARGRISDVMLDRLRLDEGRIAAMAEGIRATVKLPDHTGRILSETHHANGMTIYKKQVPLGLVAIIYESRPNVTSDAAALTVKSGNVCVLRSGKEAVRTSTAIVKALKQGISAVGGDGLLDDIADDLFEGLLTGLAGRSRLRHGPQSPLFGEHIGHRPGPDVGAVRQGGEGAQDVLELGVIVGPGVLAEHLDGPGLEARELLAQLEVQAVEVEAGQRWDLVGAAAQGGQGKGQ